MPTSPLASMNARSSITAPGRTTVSGFSSQDLPRRVGRSQDPRGSPALLPAANPPLCVDRLQLGPVAPASRVDRRGQHFRPSPEAFSTTMTRRAPGIFATSGPSDARQSTARPRRPGN